MCLRLCSATRRLPSHWAFLDHQVSGLRAQASGVGASQRSADILRAGPTAAGQFVQALLASDMFAGSSNKLRTVGRAVHAYEGYEDSDIKLVWMSLPMRVWALLGARFGASGEREQEDAEGWLKGQEEDEVIRVAAPRRQGLRTSGDGTDDVQRRQQRTQHFLVLARRRTEFLGTLQYIIRC